MAASAPSTLWKQLIWSFYLPSILAATAASLLVPVLPVYAGSLTQAYVLIGIVLGAQNIGNVLGDIPASILLRRYGLRPAMLIGLLLMGLPLIPLGFTRNIWLLGALLILSGMGLAFYNIARHAYISAAVPNAQRGRIISIFGGVYRLGKFLGPALGGWVGGTFFIQMPFLVYAGLVFAAAGIVWALMLPVPLNPTDPDKAAPTHAHISWRQLLQTNRAILRNAGIGQILAQFTRNGWMVIIPLYGANILRLDVQTIGVVMSLGAALDAGFFYLSGIIMDRYGRKWAIVPSFVLQGCAVALIPLAGGMWGLAFVSGLIGLANAISSGTMMTLGSDLAPPETRGEFLAVWRLIGDVGFVLSPLIVGAVAQVLALQSAIVVIATTAFITAAVFTWFVPETLKRPQIIYQSTGG